MILVKAEWIWFTCPSNASISLICRPTTALGCKKQSCDWWQPANTMFVSVEQTTFSRRIRRNEYVSHNDAWKHTIDLCQRSRGTIHCHFSHHLNFHCHLLYLTNPPVIILHAVQPSSSLVCNTYANRWPHLYGDKCETLYHEKKHHRHMFNRKTGLRSHQNFSSMALALSRCPIAFFNTKNTMFPTSTRQ